MHPEDSRWGSAKGFFAPCSSFIRSFEQEVYTVAPATSVCFIFPCLPLDQKPTSPRWQKGRGGLNQARLEVISPLGWETAGAPLKWWFWQWESLIYVLVPPSFLPSSPGCPPACSGSGIWPGTGSPWEQAGPPSERSAGLPTARRGWLSPLTEGPWSLADKTRTKNVWTGEQIKMCQSNRPNLHRNCCLKN